MHKTSRAQSKDRSGIVEKSFHAGQRMKDPKRLRIKRNGHPPDGSHIESDIILQGKRHQGWV